MAQTDIRIRRRQALDDLNAACGLKINHAWLGYANALFLECGKLTAPQERQNNPKGQVTFMLDCRWRVMNKYSVDFGCDNSDRIIENRVLKLIGTVVESIDLSSGMPELSIGLSSGRNIETFQSYKGSPEWSVGFYDVTLVEMEQRWTELASSMWISFSDKSFLRSYCYD
jgi:hypothetical protein